MGHVQLNELPMVTQQEQIHPIQLLPRTWLAAPRQEYGSSTSAEVDASTNALFKDDMI